MERALYASRYLDMKVEGQAVQMAQGEAERVGG